MFYFKWAGNCSFGLEEHRVSRFQYEVPQLSNKRKNQHVPSLAHFFFTVNGIG